MPSNHCALYEKVQFVTVAHSAHWLQLCYTAVTCVITVAA